MNPFRSQNRPGEPEEPRKEGQAAPGASRQPADPADVDQTAALIGQLEQERAVLAGERDEAREAHRRAIADFQNFQRRAYQNEQQAREQAIRGVLGSVIGVMDHFDMALSQDPAKTTPQQIITGVSMAREELNRALQQHGVALIQPARNDPFDPTRHEAVTQQAADGVDPGHVVMSTRAGYTVNDRVVRPAQVIVAPKMGG
jgi:molecular chaperone GrpE